MEHIQLSLFGKTCQEPFQATGATIFDASFRRSQKLTMRGGIQFLDLRKGGGITQERFWQTDGAWRGDCSTLNTGECPSVARESTLSQILEVNVPEKYYLSARACDGILRRAERRGKDLPAMLKAALEQQIERERYMLCTTGEVTVTEKP